MPVHGAVMVRLCNADAVPAQPGLVHGLAESGECINQIVTALPDRGTGPLRIRPAVVESCVEA